MNRNSYVNNLDSFRKMLGINRIEFAQQVHIKEGFYDKLKMNGVLFGFYDGGFRTIKNLSDMYKLSGYLDDVIESLVTNSNRHIDYNHHVNEDYEYYHCNRLFEFSGPDALTKEPYKWVVNGDLLPILNNDEFIFLKAFLVKWREKFDSLYTQELAKGNEDLADVGFKILPLCLEDLKTQYALTDEQVKRFFKCLVLCEWLVKKQRGD